MSEVSWVAVAAWVQAVGSILAILAAIWIGERSSRRSRALVEEERRRQADIFASTFSTRLGIQAQEAEQKAKTASQIACQSPSGPELEAYSLKKLFLMSHANQLLDERGNCLLFDRDSGIAVMTALDVLDAYNPTAEMMITMYTFRLGAYSTLSAICTTFHDRLSTVADVLRQAERRLETAHGLDSEETL